MLWLSCEGQIDVWVMFSDNSYLSAILDRQGLLVAAAVDIRKKGVESFSPQLLQGFWSKLMEKNPKIVFNVPDCNFQRLLTKRIRMATVTFVLDSGNVSNPWR